MIVLKCFLSQYLINVSECSWGRMLVVIQLIIMYNNSVNEVGNMKMVTVCSCYSAFKQLGPCFIFWPTAHMGLIYKFISLILVQFLFSK